MGRGGFLRRTAPIFSEKRNKPSLLEGNSAFYYDNEITEGKIKRPSRGEVRLDRLSATVGKR
jgi:hypothetical protein